MIYIGIPVHNERQTIGPLLWRIRELLFARARDFHVVVLDDASTDGTGERLAAYGRVLPMTILRNEARRGYAASLERLLREAVSRSDYPRRDALVTLQADFTDAPEAIPEMIRRFEGGVDVLLAVPRREGEDPGEEENREAGDAGAAEVGQGTPPPRALRLARFGARFVARGFPRPPGVANPYGSFRLYRLFTLARALKDLPSRDAPLLTQQGWAANAELLLAVWPHARRVEELAWPEDYGRRYRGSRFHAVAELRSLRRGSRHPRVGALGQLVREGSAGE